MSGLALAAYTRGATVLGSDLAESSYVRRMRERGITVTIPHASRAVPHGAEIVYSSVVPTENVERQRAYALGLPQRPRGDLLAEIASDRPCIAVAGTHGKTTTAAMIFHCLRAAADQRVGYIIGGDLLATGSNAEWGDDGTWLVVETDESDRSALLLRPSIGVLTNVDHDHIKTFPTVSEVDVFFRQFLAQSETGVAPAGFGGSHLLTHAAAGLSLDRSGSAFNWRGQPIRVPLLGAHNAANAAAALEACVLAGIQPATAAAALRTFPGTRRRLQYVGQTLSGADVYDDYAHHPTAIAATVTAARLLDPVRVVVVFEPWGSLRSKILAAEFGKALGLADAAIILPHVGSVNEQVPGESTEQLVEAARVTTPEKIVIAASDYSAGCDLVEPLLGRGTVCLVLGCGQVDQFSQRLVAERPIW